MYVLGKAAWYFPPLHCAACNLPTAAGVDHGQAGQQSGKEGPMPEWFVFNRPTGRIVIQTVHIGSIEASTDRATIYLVDCRQITSDAPSTVAELLGTWD